jgi:hypothetical protein
MVIERRGRTQLPHQRRPNRATRPHTDHRGGDRRARQPLRPLRRLGHPIRSRHHRLCPGPTRRPHRLALSHHRTRRTPPTKHRHPPSPRTRQQRLTARHPLPTNTIGFVDSVASLEADEVDLGHRARRTPSTRSIASPKSTLRERHSVAGAKSDSADAVVLANILPTPVSSGGRRLRPVWSRL